MRARSPGLPVRMRWSAAGVLACVLLLGACEGSNLFEGAVTEEPPRVTSLAGPASVDAGGSLTVQVNATAPRGVGLIEVTFSGAAVGTVTEDFTGAITSASMSATVNVGQAGSQVFVEAYVEDVNFRRSQIVSRTVAVNPVGAGAPQPD